LALKSGKTACFDGVYSEFIKNSGHRTREWIVARFTDILTSGKIPKLFKVIMMFKPGKDGSDPSHFQPISLLSIVFKILERMILQRVQSLIDAVVPVWQAGKLVSNANLKQAWYLSISQLRTTPYGEMA
jgi:hypothetical protein